MRVILKFFEQFAVPDMRNLATQVRIILICIFFVFYIPLMMSHFGVDYWMRVYNMAAWVAPLVLLNMILTYLFFPYLYSLPQRYAVVIGYIASMMIFILVDYVLLKDHVNVWQRFWQVNLVYMITMYMEANRRQALEPALAEARLTALTARIRPHFLFNSLNAAISLIRLRPYDAEMLLENLANLFRAQLRDGSQSSTLGQEIEWAQEYIAIEQVRMGPTRVQVMWHHHAPDDAETLHLLLQPLLENAVFHGIESTHRPGCIVVETVQKHNWLYISIENPYIPPESSDNVKPHKGNSMALRNLKERMALMYDNDATVNTEQTDTTFRVRIRLPYRKKDTRTSRLFG